MQKSQKFTTYLKFLARNWAKLHTLMVSVPSPSANDATQAKKGHFFNVLYSLGQLLNFGIAGF